LRKKDPMDYTNNTILLISFPSFPYYLLNYSFSKRADHDVTLNSIESAAVGYQFLSAFWDKMICVRRNLRNNPRNGAR